MGMPRTYSDSLGRVFLKHTEKQVSDRALDFVRHFEYTSLDLHQQNSDIVVIKWQPSGDEGEQDDTARPDIRCGSVIGFALLEQKGRARTCRNVRIRRTQTTKLERKTAPTATISGLA